jgi:hypothetical protein
MRSTPAFARPSWLASVLVVSGVVVAVIGCDASAPPPSLTDAGVVPGLDAGPTPTVDAGPPPPTGETGRLVGMVAAHNRWRASIGASPAIPPVTWSTDLAAIAQAYSETLASSGCGLTHSSGPYGENLAWFSGTRATPDRVVDGWASEQSCYTYGTFMGTDACTSACDRFGGCGHYTQVIWRGTERIGCGVATCPSGAEIWTCNYDPPGNYLGMAPY